MPPFLVAFLTRWGALLGVAVACFTVGFLKGDAHATRVCDADKAQVQIEVVREQAKKQEVANDVQIKYVDRVKVVHDQLAAVSVALPPAVEAGCHIPAGSFARLWNDANAATGDPAARDVSPRANAPDGVRPAD